jgi:hypothetical protein
MPRLLHHTMTPLQRRKRLIKIIHLINLVFRSIPMLICFQFNLVNLHTVMERTTCWGPSASEGLQKHDLTMSLEYNVWTGIFELEPTV